MLFIVQGMSGYGGNKFYDTYYISARELSQHVLPATPATVGCYPTDVTTRVYGYGTTTKDGKSTHNWPGFTIEAQVHGLGTTHVAICTSCVCNIIYTVPHIAICSDLYVTNRLQS